MTGTSGHAVRSFERGLVESKHTERVVSKSGSTGNKRGGEKEKKSTYGAEAIAVTSLSSLVCVRGRLLEKLTVNADE
jgi:hypothetical protein